MQGRKGQRSERASREPVRRIGADPGAARELLNDPGVEALEMPQTPLDEAPYRDLVRAFLRSQPFTLNFKQSSPAQALAMLSGQLLGPGLFTREQALLAQDVAALAEFAQALSGGPQVQISVRNWFAPGDLVWHFDRSLQPKAFRVLWPLGRPAGMKITPADNIDARVHRAYMNREYPLLYQLDRRIMRTPSLSGSDLETLWAHRPVQAAAMISGRFPFVRDSREEWAIKPHAASVHRIETPSQTGTYHRSSWENRLSPGFQFVMTAGSA